MQKFTEDEQTDFDAKQAAADQETRDKYAPEIATKNEEFESTIAQAKAAKDSDRRKALQAELKQYQREIEAKIQTEARALLKSRFPYPCLSVRSRACRHHCHWRD